MMLTNIQAVLMAVVNANDIGITRLEIICDRVAAEQYPDNIPQSDKMEIRWVLIGSDIDGDYEF